VYGVLGEDASDADTIKELIRQLAGDPRLPIKAKGFGGCGEMLNLGASHLRALTNLGCDRFVVTYDADEKPAHERRAEVMGKIVAPAGVQDRCCILIPVQEIEAWILADIEAVSKVLSSWRPKPIKQNPESIRHPKEYLESQSRRANRKPIYSHATHNPLVARYLRPDRVGKKCPSFRPLVEFIRNA
jgi:hypothetical protein